MCRSTSNFFCQFAQQQIQDAADQGVMFVGFVQEPYGAPCTTIREPDTPSLSLHSSPSSVLGSLGSCSPSNPSSPWNRSEPRAQEDMLDKESCGKEGPDEEKNTGNHSGNGTKGLQDKDLHAASPISEGDLERTEELTSDDSLSHNNNKDSVPEAKERPRYRLRRGNGEWSPWLHHKLEPKSGNNKKKMFLLVFFVCNVLYPRQTTGIMEN